MLKTLVPLTIKHRTAKNLVARLYPRKQTNLFPIRNIVSNIVKHGGLGKQIVDRNIKKSLQKM